MRKKKDIIKVVSILVFIIVVAFLFLPDLWMIFASFERGATLNTTLPTLRNATLSNYIGIFPEMFTPLLNSLYICGLATFVTVIISSIAAYPLSRYEFKLKWPIMWGMLFLSVLPITAMMVPTYSMFVITNLYNQRWAVSLFLAATALPVGIWIMKGFFDSIPVELEEAAWVDGSTKFGSLIYVVMPLSIPGITVVALLTFVGQWGNFYVPFILLSSNNKIPISASIYTFFTSYGVPEYGQLAAYSIIYSCVPIIIYFFTGKGLRAGLNVGGLKG